MKNIRTAMAVGTIGAMLFPALAIAAGTAVHSDASSDTSIQAAHDTGFLSTFLEGGNGSFIGATDATFDVQAFRSHPCFHAVGQEQEYCLQAFGIQSDFADMIQSDTLGTLIIEHALQRRCHQYEADMLESCLAENAALMPRLMAQFNLQTGTGSLTDDGPDVASDADDDQTPANGFTSRYQRSQRLWELCDGREETQSGCYQTYIRFVTDETRSLSDLENVFGSGTADDDADDANDEDAMSDDDQTDDVDQDVQSDTDDEDAGVLPVTQRQRTEWLWDLCAARDAREMCYRTHYRAVIDEDTDLRQLAEGLRG